MSAASHCQRTIMKTTFLTCLCLIALGLSGFGQTPTVPATSVSAAPSPGLAAAGSTPSVTASAASDRDDSIQSEVTRKLKRKFGIDIDMDHGSTHISRHH